MKFYRLSETHINYGLAGNVIDSDTYRKNIPYNDKPLYDLIDEHGRGYPYKVVMTPAGRTPSLFYMEDYEDLVLLLKRLASREGIREQQIPIVVPNCNAEVRIAMNELKIYYRIEWQQDSPNSMQKDT